MNTSVLNSSRSTLGDISAKINILWLYQTKDKDFHNEFMVAVKQLPHKIQEMSKLKIHPFENSDAVREFIESSEHLIQIMVTFEPKINELLTELSIIDLNPNFVMLVVSTEPTDTEDFEGLTFPVKILKSKGELLKEIIIHSVPSQFSEHLLSLDADLLLANYKEREEQISICSIESDHFDVLLPGPGLPIPEDMPRLQPMSASKPLLLPPPPKVEEPSYKKPILIHRHLPKADQNGYKEAIQFMEAIKMDPPQEMPSFPKYMMESQAQISNLPENILNDIETRNGLQTKYSSNFSIPRKVIFSDQKNKEEEKKVENKEESKVWAMSIQSAISEDEDADAVFKDFESDQIRQNLVLETKNKAIADMKFKQQHQIQFQQWYQQKLDQKEKAFQQKRTKNETILNVPRRKKKDGFSEKIQPKGFQLSRILGYGTFGITHTAYKKNSSKWFIVKEIILSQFSEVDRENCIKAEQKYLSQFEDLSHKNICKVVSISERYDRLYFVYQMAPGCGLHERIKESRKLKCIFTEKQIVFIYLQLLNAIRYSHQLGIIHFDLSPKKIIIAPGDTIKIASFGVGRGIEKILADQINRNSNYMAPEVAEKRQYSTSSDMWSLGVILFQICSLTTRKEISALLSQKKKFKINDSLYNSKLQKLIQGMTQLNPKKRISDEEALETMLSIYNEQSYESPNIDEIQPEISSKVFEELNMDKMDLLQMSPNEFTHLVVSNPKFKQVLDSIYLSNRDNETALTLRERIEYDKSLKSLNMKVQESICFMKKIANNTCLFQYRPTDSLWRKKYIHYSENILTNQMLLLTIQEDLFMIGGADWNGEALNLCKKVEVESGIISDFTKMRIGRFGHAGITYLNSNLFVFGGRTGKSFLNSCESHKLDSQKWKAFPKLLEPKAHFGAEIVRNKLFYLFGGIGENFAPLTSINVYNIETPKEKWSLVKLKNSRGFTGEKVIVSAVLGISNTILIFGNDQTAYLFNYEKNSLEKTTNIPDGVYFSNPLFKPVTYGDSTYIFDDYSNLLIFQYSERTWRKVPPMQLKETYYRNIDEN